jgi:hypothetical protein
MESSLLHSPRPWSHRASLSGVARSRWSALRLEARAAVQNIRGNRALQKIGAMQEGILRKSFLRDGKLIDQARWAILDEDWYRTKAVWGEKVS